MSAEYAFGQKTQFVRIGDAEWIATTLAVEFERLEGIGKVETFDSLDLRITDIQDGAKCFKFLYGTREKSGSTCGYIIFGVRETLCEDVDRDSLNVRYLTAYMRYYKKADVEEDCSCIAQVTTGTATGYPMEEKTIMGSGVNEFTAITMIYEYMYILKEHK